MSKLDELISELCPNGVEYKELAAITTKLVDGMHSLPKGLSDQDLYNSIRIPRISAGFALSG